MHSSTLCKVGCVWLKRAVVQRFAGAAENQYRPQNNEYEEDEKLRQPQTLRTHWGRISTRQNYPPNT